MMLRLVILVVGIVGLVQAQSRESCIGSSCKTYKEVNTLWCHADPMYFCQCRTDVGGGWVEQVMPCALGGTMFSFKKQTCVLEEHWDKNDCMRPDLEEQDPVAVEIACTNPCKTYEEISKLSCHSQDRKAFCQCRPTAVPRVFEPIKMPCANGTTFSYKRQTCMTDALWTDSCPV